MPEPDQSSLADRRYELFALYRSTGDRRVRNEIVEGNLDIAVQEARRFANRGEPLDDLVQVARIGLLKAVERFNPEIGVPFAAYARPTVAGELRRHFRDRTWSVHVPRGLKDVHTALGNAASELSNQLGRHPTAAELADRLRCSVDEVLEALELRSAYRPVSLSATPSVDSPKTIEPSAAEGNSAIDQTIDRVALRTLIDRLPSRERRIVCLRFFGELSQSEIADRMGMSQVHVSRLLRASLATMRASVADTEGVQSDG